MTRQLRWYTEMFSSHWQCYQVIDEKISDRMIVSDDEFESRNYICLKK